MYGVSLSDEVDINNLEIINREDSLQVLISNQGKSFGEIDDRTGPGINHDCLYLNNNKFEYHGPTVRTDTNKLKLLINQITKKSVFFNGSYEGAISRAMGEIQDQFPGLYQYSFLVLLESEFNLSEFQEEIDKYLETDNIINLSYKILKIIEYSFVKHIIDATMTMKYLKDADMLLITLATATDIRKIKLTGETIVLSAGKSISQLRHPDMVLEDEGLYSYVTGEFYRLNYFLEFGFYSFRYKYTDLIKIARDVKMTLLLMQQDDLMGPFSYQHKFEEHVGELIHTTVVFSSENLLSQTAGRVACATGSAELIKESENKLGTIISKSHEKQKPVPRSERYDMIISKYKLADRYFYDQKFIVIQARRMIADIKSCLYLLQVHSGCLYMSNVAKTMFKLTHEELIELRKDISIIALTAYNRFCLICCQLCQYGVHSSDTRLALNAPRGLYSFPLGVKWQYKRTMLKEYESGPIMKKTYKKVVVNYTQKDKNELPYKWFSYYDMEFSDEPSDISMSS